MECSDRTEMISAWTWDMVSGHMLSHDDDDMDHVGRVRSQVCTDQEDVVTIEGLHLMWHQWTHHESLVTTCWMLVTWNRCHPRVWSTLDAANSWHPRVDPGPGLQQLIWTFETSIFVREVLKSMMGQNICSAFWWLPRNSFFTASYLLFFGLPWE